MPPRADNVWTEFVRQSRHFLRNLLISCVSLNKDQSLLVAHRVVSLHRNNSAAIDLAVCSTCNHTQVHMWAISNGSHVGNINSHRNGGSADFGILLGERREWKKVMDLTRGEA
jgi:hypothetical protein